MKRRSLLLVGSFYYLLFYACICHEKVSILTIYPVRKYVSPLEMVTVNLGFFCLPSESKH